jgi:hypothetical protein
MPPRSPRIGDRADIPPSGVVVYATILYDGR